MSLSCTFAHFCSKVLKSDFQEMSDEKVSLYAYFEHIFSALFPKVHLNPLSRVLVGSCTFCSTFSDVSPKSVKCCSTKYYSP